MNIIDFEASIKCSENLCNVILSDVVDLLNKSQNVDATSKRTLELIEDIGSEKKMLLHEYDENKITCFTLINEEDENHITVKIIIHNENTVYIELTSNLDRDKVYGALN